MDIEEEFLLVNRLVKERPSIPNVEKEITELLKEAQKLKSKHNEIAHGMAAIAFAGLEPQEPGDYVAGIQRPKQKRPEAPPEGFRSQAQFDQHLRHCMHRVPQIDEYYERTVTLNRRAWTVGPNLRAARAS